MVQTTKTHTTEHSWQNSMFKMPNPRLLLPLMLLNLHGWKREKKGENGNWWRTESYSTLPICSLFLQSSPPYRQVTKPRMNCLSIFMLQRLIPSVGKMGQHLHCQPSWMRCLHDHLNRHDSARDTSIPWRRSFLIARSSPTWGLVHQQAPTLLIEMLSSSLTATGLLIIKWWNTTAIAIWKHQLFLSQLIRMSITVSW